MADEKLEKRSKNVREQTRDLPPEKKKSRIMDYIRRAGFRAEAARSDRFGVGKDQRTLQYNSMAGAPEHELAHAYMTPAGENLREHQKKLGQVSTNTGERGMTYPEAISEESAAFGMEPAIGRRAGVQIKRGVGANSSGSPIRLPGVDHQRGLAELNALDEGRKVITPKGQVTQGTGVHAKINTRANLVQKSETMSTDLTKKDPSDADILDPKEAPTPTTPKAAGLETPMWQGRSILHPNHGHGIDTEAAMNEFGHKMPREEAESKAYDKYVRSHRVAAASHHLDGMKAAHEIGDMESARKHSLMYNLHMKALGHEPVGPVHPDVVAYRKENPSKVYRFKAHKGDVFAVKDHGAEEKTEKVEKSETLTKQETAYLGALLAAGEAFLIKAEKKVPCVCTAYHFPHRHRSGKCGKPWDMDKGELVPFPGNKKPAVDQGREAPVSAIAAAPVGPSTDDLLYQHCGASGFDDNEDRHRIFQSLMQHHGLDKDSALAIMKDPKHQALGLDDATDRSVLAQSIDALKNK